MLRLGKLGDAVQDIVAKPLPRPGSGEFERILQRIGDTARVHLTARLERNFGDFVDVDAMLTGGWDEFQCFVMMPFADELDRPAGTNVFTAGIQDRVDPILIDDGA